MMALVEMYVQGVSTHKVAAITERLCCSEISSTHMNKAVTLLGEVLKAWRNRPLRADIYLFLDELHEKVRLDGRVRDEADLISRGVSLEGKHLILDVFVSLDKQEFYWQDFLKNLVERGLNGVERVVSDAHVGLQAARKAIFSGVPW